jgi:hypothetical protein
VLIAIAILVLQNPFVVLSPGQNNFGDYDIAWLIGLEWAKIKNLSFGSDIAFTYGPLHFLHFGPVNIGNAGLLLIEELVYVLMRFAVIYLFVRFFMEWKRDRSWADLSITEQALTVLIVAVNILIPFVTGEALTVIALIIFLKLILETDVSDRKNFLPLIILNAFIISTVCMIKFSGAMLIFTIMAIAFFGMLCKRKGVLILWFIPAFLLSNVIMWLLCRQDISALAQYYVRSMEVSAGYTEAMMNDLFRAYNLVAILVTLVAGVFFLMFSAKKNFDRALIFLILLPVLFMSYKEGATRVDSFHIYSFYNKLALILFVLLIFCVKTKDATFRMPVYLLCFLLILCSIRIHYMPAKVGLSPNKQWLINQDAPLPQKFLSEVGNETVDIFPWNISLLYVYGLNWSPRLVFQSYSAYTQKLDSINAEHFKGSDAPKNVVFQYYHIDRRYMLFDEPMVFRTLLENYETREYDDNYLILGKNPTDENKTYQKIGGGKSAFNSEIAAPQVVGKPVYCRLNISMNATGKIMNILQKTNYFYIHFTVKGYEKPVTYRFIRAVAQDGLFVSKYIADIFDLQAVFDGRYEPDIESVRITVPGENRFYEPVFEYEFFTEE